MAAGAALITGASSGIGREIAHLCAAAGYPVVLLARNEAALHDLASQLGPQARVLEADLSDPAAPAAIFDQLRGVDVELLINNAGFGLRGPFAETGWDAESRLIQVNVVALAYLTKLLLPGMLQRRSGRILNVASTAAFVPGPFMAAYYASKAFVRSFSESLAEEVAGSGVTVTVLCPGPTETAFADRAGIGTSPLFRGSVMSARDVARIGFDAMMSGKREVIAGGRNRAMMFFTRFAPRSVMAKVTGRLNGGD
jgi:short-subunit dehydrogenase